MNKKKYVKRSAYLLSFAKQRCECEIAFDSVVLSNTWQMMIPRRMLNLTEMSLSGGEWCRWRYFVSSCQRTSFVAAAVRRIELNFNTGQFDHDSNAKIRIWLVEFRHQSSKSRFKCKDEKMFHGNFQLKVFCLANFILRWNFHPRQLSQNVHSNIVEWWISFSKKIDFYFRLCSLVISFCKQISTDSTSQMFLFSINHIES